MIWVVNGEFAFQPTDDQVRADFERLCARDATTFVDTQRPWNTRFSVPSKRYLYRMLHTGQLLSMRFHWHHRVRTSTLWHPSAHSILQRRLCEPAYLKDADARLQAQGGSAAAIDARAAFRVIERNSALLTVTHFRATVSKHLCDVYRARDVLDFSAGWGDRLTGFLASASVQSITLIDPRRGSIEGCVAQHSFVHSTKTLHTHQAGAEVVMPTLADQSYDLVVTSPPYLSMEKYGDTSEESEGQIRTRARTMEEYVDLFLRPVITHAARVLRPGGVLALNVDDNVVAGMFLCAPTLALIDGLSDLQFLGTAGLRKGRGFGKCVADDSAPRAEPIFLAQKRGEGVAAIIGL